MPPSPQTSFLDPVVLGRIGDLALVARTVVAGFLHGMHRSFHSGQSVDFAQHRPYQPGDDLRRIDWRVYGRTDKFFLKTYESDTNASVRFCVDVSGSMDYGSIGITKFRYAQMLAASLAWLSQHQGDRVGLITLTAEMADVVPPSTRHLQLLLHTLGRAKPLGVGQLPKALNLVARSQGKPGILVLVSDCYEEPEVLGNALGALRTRGHDLIVFHLIDPAERDLPFDTPGTFEDAETGQRLALQPEELRVRYQELLARHREALQRQITNQGADYIPIETDQPLDAALRGYLDHRLMGERPPLMPFSFLIPAFFAGMLALGIPILMHLRQRERQKPHRFPSLMFLRRIPIETSKQKRVTDIPLLLLRLLALALLILAFTRPYLSRRDPAEAVKGEKTVVIALDRSMSMGAKGLWERALDSSRAVLSRLSPGDRVAIIAFDEEATIEQSFTRDAVSARDVLARIKPGGRATRYVTALRTARELLLDDSVRVAEIVLVTDLQRSGNATLAGMIFPETFTLTTVAVPHDSLANAAIVGLDVQRIAGESRGSAVLAARVATRGLTAERKAKFTLTMNGRASGTKEATLARDGITSVTFDAVTLPLGKIRVTVAGENDALAADDSFHVVLPDEASMQVLLAAADGREESTLYLERALGIGRDPMIRIERYSPRALTAASLRKAGAVILFDDIQSPALEKWVRDGGGLILVAGSKFGAHGSGDFLPAATRPMIQRTADRGASFGTVLLEHMIFSPFRAGGNASLSTARFFRYPQLVPASDAEVLASFDDGNAAVVERKVGLGRVIMVAVPLDVIDGDFPLHGGAYLPFLRRLALYAAGQAAAPLWRATGDGWAASNTVREPAIRTPSGNLFRPTAAAGSGAVRLEDAGFYEVFDGSATGEPVDLVAANTPAAESDLTPLDPGELLLGVGADSLGGGSAGPEPPREVEGRQRLWRNLLILAAVLLLIETVIASRGWRGTADQLPAGPAEERIPS